MSLDTDVQVYATNLLGRNAYKNGGIYPLLAQKTPAEFNFEFPRPFWGGIYRITGNAEYNGDANAALGSLAPKNVRKYAPSQWLFVIPQPKAALIELLILLLAIVIMWIALRRFKIRRRTARSWQIFKVEEGDTLVGLARSRRTNWKTIAKVNKLRAPYELKTGTKIKLPAKTKEK